MLKPLIDGDDVYREFLLCYACFQPLLIGEKYFPVYLDGGGTANVHSTCATWAFERRSDGLSMDGRGVGLMFSKRAMMERAN